MKHKLLMLAVAVPIIAVVLWWLQYSNIFVVSDKIIIPIFLTGIVLWIIYLLKLNKDIEDNIRRMALAHE